MKSIHSVRIARRFSLYVVFFILASTLFPTAVPQASNPSSGKIASSHDLLATSAAGSGGSRTYTTSADFDEGALINVVDSIPDQLQLDDTTRAFNFIWVAASGRGTVVKIDTTTGQILGEYLSSPQGRARNPSRTTVDKDGNVWVGNRDEGSTLNGQAMGSVVHIGLQENGQCEDRNANGLIDTSSGLGDIRPWLNTGGVDNAGGVSTAQDECMIHYVRTNGANIRQVSVDGNNNVWVGGAAFGSSPRYFDQLDSQGNILRSINLTSAADTGNEGNIVQCCYGGLVDPNGVLWSATAGGNRLLRIDPSFPNGSNDLIQSINLGRFSYGMGIDPQGNIWVSNWYFNTIQKISPAGAILGTFGTGGPGNDRGVAVTSDGHVWVANSGGSSVSRLDNNGQFLAQVVVAREPTGVAVDAAGKVWATNRLDNSVSRIDPATNTVDLTRSLGSGALPYNYSDMTGSTLTGAPDEGTWTVVYDSGITAAEWGSLRWTAEVAGDGSLLFTAASSEDGLNFGPEETAGQGADLGVANGRYLRIRVKFDRASSGESPILYDLTVSTANQPPQADAGPDQVVNEGSVVSLDGTGSSDPNGDPLTYSWEIVSQAGPSALLSSSRTPDPSFLATDDGSYVFRLTVSDGRESDSDEVAVTVENVAPAISPAVDQGFAGGLTLATATFTDTGWIDLHTASIVWGDGSPAEVAQVIDGAGWGSLFGSHIYATPGSYTITIVVTDDDGGEASAQTGTVEILEPYAIWANSQTAAKTLDWVGGEGWVYGRVHTNKDLVVHGNVKHFLGTTTYVSSLVVNKPNDYSFDPLPQQVAPMAFPFRYDLTDFRPGGAVAQAVAERYFDRSAECGADGFWHTENQVLPPGVYYVSCAAKLNGSSIGGSITLAAEGSIQVSGSRPAFEPFYDGLLFLSGSNSDKAVDISASGSKFLGYVFSEFGQIDISGADNRFYCGLLGDRVSLSASDLIVRGSGCSRPERTVAVTALVPTIELGLNVDRSDALPGDDLTYDLSVANTGASLLVPGVIGGENVDLADATLAYYAFQLEYFSETDSAWLPLAGASAALPGYTPTDPAPISGGLSFQASPNPAAGVAYPASGDPLLGTVLQPGGLASWGYQALVSLSPAQVEMLLDPDHTGGIRSAVLFEFTPADVQVRRLFRFGTDFIQALRELSGDMSQVALTFIPPTGDLVFFDTNTTPALQSIPPGGSADLGASFTVPSFAPRGPAETEAGYRARLQALDGASLRASAYATAQGGVGLLVAPEQSATSTQHLPILSLARQAPAAIAAGATASFDLQLYNAGSATASTLNLQDTLAGSIDLVVTGVPASLGPVEVASAHSSYPVPADSPGGDLAGQAVLTWQDANGNPYGPLYSNATTAVIAAPILSAAKSDALQLDADGNGVPSAGDTLAYQVTLQNSSTGPAAGVRFLDAPDANTQLVVGSVTASQGTVTLGNAPGNASVEVDVGTLPGGGSATIAFQVTLNDPLPDGVTQVANQGSLESLDLPPVLTDDPATPGANDPTVTPITQPGSSLGGSLADFLALDLNGSGAADPGDTLRYELSVYNNGDGPTSGVTLSLAPDAITQVVIGSVTTSQGTVVAGNGAGDTSILVDIGTLAAGASAHITFRLQIAAPLPPGATSVVVQGTLTSNELAPVLTDDPEAPGDQDATTTPVFVPPPDLPAPTIGEVSPPDGEVVTEPVPIQAALEPPPGETITAWWVTYQRVGTPTVVEIARGTSLPLAETASEAAVLAEGQAQADPTTLVTFDPTRLPNGTYIITVNATASGGGTTSVSSSLIVDGGLKLGRYMVTYQDLWVPLAGLPMQVLRTYDSYDKAVGDFGVGWNVEIANFQVSTSRRLGEGGWQQYTVSCGLIFCTTGYRTTIPHFITVTWPDGRQEIFDLTPINGSTFFPILTAAAFTGRPGTTSTLAPVGDATLAYFSDGNLYGGLFGSGGIYDPQQFLLTDRNGNAYLLDRSAGLLRATDRNGNTLTVSPNGILSSLGPSVTFSRDAQDRITQIGGPSGETLLYTYSPAGDLASFTDTQSRTITYEYDSDHNLLASNGPDGMPFRTTTYDTEGRLVEVTDGEGNTVQIDTDVAGRQEIVTDAVGRLTTITTYDAEGNAISIEEVFDGLSRLTRFEYDESGNLVTLIDPMGYETHVTYDTYGNVTSVTDALERTAVFNYDTAGELISAFAPDGTQLVHITRDANENPTRIDYGGGVVIQLGYDSAGRVRSITNPLGGVSTASYDSAGNLSEYRDPSGATVQTVYDSSNRLVSMIDPTGAVTQFEYDGHGNLVRMTDALGHTWDYSYDYQGHLLSFTDPLGQSRTWSYDAAGRAVLRSDRDGGQTTYEYDANGRLIQQTLADGSQTLFTYDGLGRLVSASNADVLIDMELDLTNLISRITTSGVGGSPQPATSVDYGYDPVGNLASMLTAEGPTDYQYDVLDRITEVTGPDGGAFTFSRDPQGRLTSLARPNGVTSTYSWNPAQDIVDIVHRNGGAILDEIYYSYGPSGLRTAVTDLAGTHSYSYDAAGQLVQADHPALFADEAYTYDAVGNRISTGEVYDAANRLLEDDRAFYTYDGEGNLLTRADKASGDVTRFAWNSDGQLVSVEAPDGSLTTYRYDPFGRRIEVASPTGTTRFGYGAEDNVLVAYDSSNQPIAHFTHALLNDALLSLRQAGGTFYYLQDALGTVTSLAGAGGARQDTYHYGAFGQPAWLTPSVANLFTFTGREYEAGSQTYYYRSRYYDPFSGRFLGEDPLMSINPYPYAQNNPISYRDPSGAQATTEYSQLLRDRYRQSNQVGYTVYRFFDAQAQRWYYGISRNMYSRILAHGSRITPGTFAELGTGINTWARARGIEQALIQSAGGASHWGGPLANVINSISPQNPAYQRLVSYGMSWIRSNLGSSFIPLPPVP